MEGFETSSQLLVFSSFKQHFTFSGNKQVYYGIGSSTNNLKVVRKPNTKWRLKVYLTALIHSEALIDPHYIILRKVVFSIYSLIRI